MIILHIDLAKMPTLYLRGCASIVRGTGNELEQNCCRIKKERGNRETEKSYRKRDRERKRERGGIGRHRRQKERESKRERE